MGEKIIDGRKAGKEANNISEQALDVENAQEFINEMSVYDFILNLNPEKCKGNRD